MFEKVNEWFEEQPPAVPLETQLEKLAELGITLKEGVGEEQLLVNFTREELEENPYSMLFSALGGVYENENGEWLPLSDDILYLDSECVEENGIYSEIIRRLAAMTRGVLAVADPEDEIFPQDNKAVVKFSWNGEPKTLELELIGSQIDTTLFLCCNELLSLQGVKEAFYLHLNEREVAVVFMDKKRAKQLGSLSGVYFE